MSSSRASLTVGLHPVLRHRVLVPVEAQPLQLAADPQRVLVGVVSTPRVEHQHHLVAHRSPNLAAHPDIPVHIGRPRQGGLTCRGIPVVVRVNLVGAVALTLALDGVGGVLVGRSEIVETAGVGLDPVPGTAQQFVYGQPGDSAGQIPQGEIDDAADVFGKLRRPQLPPDLCPVERVLAGKQRAQELPDHRLVPGEQAVLVAMEVTTEVVALDPFIGEHLGHGLHHAVVGHQLAERDSIDERLERDDLHAGDLHGSTFCRRPVRSE